MTTEQEDDDRMKRLAKAADALAEHFSTVQIIATVEDADIATPFNSGRGNWYARYGSVIEWVMYSEDQMLNNGQEDDDEED
jgi:hypothetical protein